MNSIYGSLLKFIPGTNKVEPSLATSYTVSKDGKTWTFQLRKGVQWEYGYGAFTCADVKFTWDFNKNPANHSFWQSNASIVQSVSCPSPYTAVFHLAHPFSGFVWDIVNVEPSTGWIMSQKAWQKLGKSGYNKTPVGTGPYMLQKLVPSQEIVLVRNPHYWGKKPAVAKVVFKVITDQQTAALAVKTGSLDVAEINPVTAQQFKNTSTAHLVVKPSLHTDWLELNTKLAPFNNVLVRRAIRDAINYKAIVKDVYRGYASPGYAGMLLKGQIGYSAQYDPQNTYNPQEAKKLLKQAGVKLPITGFFTDYNDTQDVDEAQLVQAQLQQVGIDLKARPLARGTLVQVRVAKTTPATVIGSSFDPDPNFDFSLTLIGSAIPPKGLDTARYTGIDTLYAAQNSAPTEAQRITYLHQIEQKVAKDVPVIDLQVSDDIWIVNNRVHNFTPSIYFNGNPWNQVTLSGK